VPFGSFLAGNSGDYITFRDIRRNTSPLVSTRVHCIDPVRALVFILSRQWPQVRFLLFSLEISSSHFHAVFLLSRDDAFHSQPSDAPEAVRPLHAVGKD
jgi:hypothetical protein